MSTILVFLGCLAGIVLLGFVVSRITGARAQYLETLALEPGERVLWQDDQADAYPIEARRALFTSYRRSRRRAVKVTNLRVLSGCKPLFGSNHQLEHALYPSDRALPDEANRIGGGLLTRGYQTLVFRRAHPSVSTKAPQFVELELEPSLPSSLNLSKFRIYSDHLAAFCLPE